MTDQPLALVIGATGKTGRPTVELALAAGLRARAVIRREDERSQTLRDLGAETVQGDVHDLASLRQLVSGTDRVYFTYPPQLERIVEATTNLAVAAREAGVRTVVNMSQITARPNARSPLSHQHWLAERILDWAGVGAVHLRATFFQENLLLFYAPQIASEGRIYLPYGQGQQAPIASRDLARVIVHLLQHPPTDPSEVREPLRLTGPELFDLPQIAALIGDQLGKYVQYVDLPVEQWHTILVEQVGMPEFLANHLHQVALDHQEGYFAHQTDTVEALTGSPPQGLRDFVREHEAQFSGREPVFLGL